MKHSAAILALSLATLATGAKADANWGCEVLLCLSNPAGPTAVSECKPPIKKLWKHLAKGKSFPTCAMGDSSAESKNKATQTWASAENCPPQYIRYTRDDNERPYCMFAGAISITIDGKPYSRVWWNGGDSVTEALNPQAKGPGYTNRYERDFGAWKAEQDRIAAQRAREADSN